MPAKKKEVKQETPAFVDEVGTFVHEQECARYRGGIRRFGLTSSQTAGGASGVGGGGGTGAGSTGASNSSRGNKGGGNQGSSVGNSSGRRVSSSNSGGAGGGGGGAASGSGGGEEGGSHHHNTILYRHGHGTYLSPQIRYVGDWMEDEMHGRGHLEFFSSGHVYDGEFCYGRFQGYGVYQWPDGSRYEGNWMNSKMHGEGIYTDTEGRVWKGKYYNGNGPGLQQLLRSAVETAPR